MYNHYHTEQTIRPYLDEALAATSTVNSAVEVYDYLNPNLRSYIMNGTSADIDERSTVYRDYEGNTYDVDEMIELLYEMNDRLKRLEKYYVGQKLEELLTSDGEDN